jgi:hypothetical protein
MPPKKEEQLQNHEKSLSPIEIQQLSQQNAIRLGVVVSDKRVIQGGDKKDKDGNLMVDNNTGEPLRYPDTYKVSLSFMGGELENDITHEQYQQLKINCTYSARGRLAPVKVFGKVEILPVFNQFVLLIDEPDF